MRTGSLLRLPAAAGLCLLLAGALPSPAQRLNVSTITFTGDDTPAADLLATTGLKPGPVDAAQVQAAAQKLNDTGMFAHIDFAVQGAALQFHLTPAEGRLPTRFENFVWWQDSTLIERVHAIVPLYHGLVIPGTGLDAQVAAALTSLTAEQHVTATIESHPETDLGSRKPNAVRYRIAAPEINIGTVTLSGESAAMQNELAPIAKAATGQPFDTHATLNLLSQAVRAVYGTHGYLDAGIAKMTQQAPVTAAQGITIPLAVDIAEGPQYRLDSIRFAQPMLLNEADFQKKVSLHPGDVVNQELLRRSLLLVSEPYRRQGYLHAKVGAEPSVDRAANKVAYLVKVEPGEIYRFGNLEMTNISDKQRAELLKSWKLHAGDAFDASYAGGFLKANASSLHSLDGYSAEYKQVEHLDTHVVDLVISFRKDKALL